MRDAVIMLLVVAVGILGYFTIAKERQIKDISAKEKMVSLELQGKCAKQADVFFKNSGWAKENLFTL